MKKKISRVTAFEWEECYGTDCMVTKIQNIGQGQIQKEQCFRPVEDFGNKETGWNKELDDFMNSIKGGGQRFQPGHTTWRYLGADDIGMTVWKQICGKWFCFKGSRLKLPDSDLKKDRGADNSEAFDNTEMNKFHEVIDSGEAEKKEINCPNETEDDAISAVDSVSTNTYKDEDRVKGTGNRKEIAEPWVDSYEYEEWRRKIVEKKYNKKNNMEG